jgi:hypothetical protein
MLSILLSALALTPGQQAPEAAAPAPPTAEQAAASPGYSYDAEGRRDPFVSLVGRGIDPAQGGTHAAGLPGLLVNEVLVKGVIRGRSGYLAMVQSPDNRTYIVRTGDRLFDGTVKTITQEGVIFSQDVNDPLSLVKQREVARRVRVAEVRGNTGQAREPK